VLAASGGFQRFCSLFPAELEFMAQKGGGRDKVRLAKGRGAAADARRRGGGGGGGGSSGAAGGGSVSGSANSGRAAGGGGRGGGGRGLGGAAGSVAEGLVNLLRSEPGGSMPAAHASRRLCALIPSSEREIAAAGGFRRFCSMFPALFGVDADGGGRGTVFLRATGAAGVGGGGGSPGQFWGEGTPLLPLPPPTAALGGRGPYPSWQPQAGAESYDPHTAAWADGPAIWARPHGPLSGWPPVGVGGGGEATLPMGGLAGLAGLRQAGCGVCGEGPAESRLVPCGHCVCRQCAHGMVMMMMVANQRSEPVSPFHSLILNPEYTIVFEIHAALTLQFLLVCLTVSVYSTIVAASESEGWQESCPAASCGLSAVPAGCGARGARTPPPSSAARSGTPSIPQKG
jgi:hypothetical protein